MLGLALEHPVDRVTAALSPGDGVRVARVTGRAAGVPEDSQRNAASVAAAALLRAHGRSEGVELEVEKGLPISGGMGGSGASAAAAAVAVDALLGLGSSDEALLEAAMHGERVASGSSGADNVAAALLGGIVLVRIGARRPLVRLPVPDDAFVALLHPGLELDTRAGRGMVPSRIPLDDAVVQWGNTAGLVAALHSGDWDLLADVLVDRVAEPRRAPRVPRFDAVREAAIAAGAAACGLSGAGPAMFALCRGRETAEGAGAAMLRALRAGDAAEGALYVSAVGRRGARVATDWNPA